MFEVWFGTVSHIFNNCGDMIRAIRDYQYKYEIRVFVVSCGREVTSYFVHN